MAKEEKEILEGIINLERLIPRFLKNWYLYLIFCIAAFFIVEYVNKYHKDKIYEAEATIHIGNEKSAVLKNSGNINFIWGGVSDKMQTQKAFLLSRSHNTKVVKKAELYIDYIQDGLIKTTVRTYKDKSPFIIELDTLHNQVINQRIFIKTLDDKSFDLFLESQNKGSIYNYKGDGDYLGEGDFNEGKLYRGTYGEVIELENSKFRIIRTDITYNEDYKYSFNLLDYLSATNKVLSGIKVSVPGNDYSLMKVSKSGTNLMELVETVNTSIEIAIEDQLKQKNRVPNNSIKYLETELSQIRSTLDKSAFDFQRVREKEKAINLSAQGGALLARGEGLGNSRVQLNTNLKILKQIKSAVENGSISQSL